MISLRSTQPRWPERFVAVLGFIVSIASSQLAPTAQAADSVPGQLDLAGREPEAQVERDWVDNRWSRTEVGQFLAASLNVSDRRIAKGLSIKVGDTEEGTVCYDTRDCAFRTAWLGGFLRFDPARFGLISPPRIAGDVAFTSPLGPAWLSRSNHYIGLHVHGKRVILEYRVDELRVLDSPWLFRRDTLTIFSRSLEL